MYACNVCTYACMYACMYVRIRLSSCLDGPRRKQKTQLPDRVVLCESMGQVAPRLESEQGYVRTSMICENTLLQPPYFLSRELRFFLPPFFTQGSCLLPGSLKCACGLALLKSWHTFNSWRSRVMHAASELRYLFPSRAAVLCLCCIYLNKTLYLRTYTYTYIHQHIHTCTYIRIHVHHIRAHTYA